MTERFAVRSRETIGHVGKGRMAKNAACSGAMSQPRGLDGRAFGRPVGRTFRWT